MRRRWNGRTEKERRRWMDDMRFESSGRLGRKGEVQAASQQAQPSLEASTSKHGQRASSGFSRQRAKQPLMTKPHPQGT